MINVEESTTAQIIDFLEYLDDKLDEKDLPKNPPLVEIKDLLKLNRKCRLFSKYLKKRQA